MGLAIRRQVELIRGYCQRDVARDAAIGIVSSDGFGHAAQGPRGGRARQACILAPTDKIVVMHSQWVSMSGNKLVNLPDYVTQEQDMPCPA